MKKILSLMLITMLASFSFVMAGPVGSINLIDNQNNPIYQESKFNPLVFLSNNGGRVLFDDNLGPFNSGDINERNGNYAFTGEQIMWTVLVWDKNGVPSKINDVYAGWVAQDNGPLDPNAQVNCALGTQLNDGDNLASNGYDNVRRPGDQEDQEEFNSATMGIYECTLTIEPSCHGQNWLGVKAVDIDDLSGTMQEAESWFCNPTMSIDVSGSVSFGQLGPGERGSSTVSVKNDAEDNSGLEVIFSISGTDFYDPSSSGAVCPVSNQLPLGQFSYSAVQGPHQVLDQTIPYGNKVTDSDPILGTPTVPTGPGVELSLTLDLELPQPCNGQFTDGDIFLWAVAV